MGFFNKILVLVLLMVCLVGGTQLSEFNGFKGMFGGGLAYAAMGEETSETANGEVDKENIIKEMEESKDWKLIVSKFVLWLVAISLAMVILTRKKAITRYRGVFLVIAVVLFGVVLKADPNPVGVIKDAFVLFANSGVIFPPRLVALSLLIITVIIGSRVFCGWACHFGSLSELMYKLKSPKVRLPFFFTNALRILTFIAMITAAFLFGLDLLGYIDPFQIYTFQPALSVIIFAILMLALSVFIYRPWCSMFCPFGLIAWLTEKISFFKIRHNQATCNSCHQCEQVCPSGAMTAIYHGSSGPDCFQCGECLEVCPTGSVTYGRKLAATQSSGGKIKFVKS